MGRNNKGKVRAKVIPPEAPRPVRKILPTPMTREEYTQLAREVAHQEITAVAKDLAAHIHNGVQQSMVPLNERFSDLYHKCNELDIHIHALVEVLNAKNLLTKPEVREAAERVTNALVARQELLKKALQEKQAQEKAAAEGGAAAVGATPRADAAEAPAAENEDDGNAAGTE